MRGRLLRLVMGVATLAMVAGLWLLPRAVISGVSAPPPSIELHPRSTAPASPEATAPSRTVDDRRDDADDGEARRGNRAQRRSSRESVPDSTWRADDDGDDQDDEAGDGEDADDGQDDD